MAVPILDLFENPMLFKLNCFQKTSLKNMCLTELQNGSCDATCLCFFPAVGSLSHQKQRGHHLLLIVIFSLTYFFFPVSILQLSTLSLPTVFLWFFSDPLNSLKRQKITQVEFCCHFSNSYFSSEGPNANMVLKRLEYRNNF